MFIPTNSDGQVSVNLRKKNKRIKTKNNKLIFYLLPSRLFLLAYTFDVLDHIRQYNQLNTIRYLLCAIYYARFTMHDLLCTMHYALCTIYYALCTMRYALCIIYYVLCAIHYALCTMYYALFTMHYALYTMHYSLCAMHYSLCTMHYAFIHIHTYLLFYTYSYVFTISHRIRRNPVILVLTRSSRRVE